MRERLALIVEDNDELALLFSLSLQAAGFATEAIPAGDLAAARLEDVVPDLVVLDPQLPRLAGEEILHQIRSDERLAETSVIVVTAYAYAFEGVSAEADLVLIKPVSLLQLRDLAARLGSSRPDLK